MGIDSVVLLLRHRGNGLFKGGGPVLAIGANLHLHAPCIKAPIVLIDAHVEGQAAHALLRAQIYGGHTVGTVEAQPAARAVVAITHKAIHKHSGTLVGVVGCRLLGECHSTQGALAELHGQAHLIAAHSTTHSHSTQGATLLHPHGALIEFGPLGGFATTCGIAYLCIVQSRKAHLKGPLALGRSDVHFHIEHIGGVVVAEVLVEPNHRLQAGEELLVVLLLGVHPLHLTQRSSTGQHHMLHVVGSFDILPPHVGLHAKDILPILLGHIAHGVVGVDILQRIIATNGKGLTGNLTCLVVVEVEGVVGGHNRAHTPLGSLDTACLATPRHHNHILAQVLAIEHLIPADDGLAPLAQKIGHLPHKPALQGLLGRLGLGVAQAQSVNAGLAFGALVPPHLGALIATDVNILIGEEGHNLLQHILGELHRLVVTHTQQVLRHTPDGPHLIGATRTSQLGVGSQCSHHMAGHINLRDDVDVSLGSVGHHLPNLLLRVETPLSIGHTVPHARIATNNRLTAGGCHRGQQGVLLNLNTPTLVIGQVPMKSVHIVQGEHINVFLHKLHPIEVARHIEVQTSVAKQGFIAHLHSRQLHAPKLTHGQGLTQSLDTIEEPIARSTHNLHSLRAHPQSVALGVGNGGVDGEHDATLYPTLRCG